MTSMSKVTKVAISILHSACKGDNVNLVKTLIHEYKANVSARDDESNTCGSIAWQRRSIALTLIRDFQCDTSAFDNNGDTPLHLFAAKGFVECLQYSLSSSAPLMVRNNSGNTPRDVATNECAKSC